eukprot:502983_1
MAYNTECNEDETPISSFSNLPGETVPIGMRPISATTVEQVELETDETLIQTELNVALCWGIVEGTGSTGTENCESSSNGCLDEGVGELVITSSRVCWLGPSSSTEIDVPYIVLHAVSRDPATFPKPCIYCQLGEGEELKEVYFVPEREERLEPMFEAFCEAAELYCPNDYIPSEDGDVVDEFRNEEVLRHLDNVLNLGQYVDGQFDDSTGEGEEGSGDNPVDDEFG